MKEHLDDEAMRLIADLLRSVMPPNYGFTLLTFELKQRHETKIKYISNAQRDDMINTMQEMLNKFKHKRDISNRNMN